MSSDVWVHSIRAVPVTQSVWMNSVTEPLLSLEVLLPLHGGMPECITH